jgi:CubicO group peptidase (beta-lactamase class C family)
MDRLRHRLPVALAMGLLLAAPLRAGRPTLAGERRAPSVPSWLDDALRGAVERHRIPGVAVALVDRDRVLFEAGYGLADRDARRAITPGTPFRVLSLTKPLVAATALRLSELGRLRLEDRVRDLAPELPLDNPWSDTHPLRVLHLLEHSSGLDDFDFDEIQARGPPPPLDELVRRSLAGRRLRWPPGTRQAYGNPGYALLGLLLQRAAEEPLEDAMRRHLFTPADMAGAAMTVRDPTRLAAGYPSADAPAVPYRDVYFRPAANAVLTARDLARFTRLLLGRGALDGVRVLARSSVDRLETRESGPAVPSHAHVGFAKGLYPRVQRSHLTLGHYGGGYAYMASFRYSHELGRGFVLLQNCSYRDRGFEELQRLLFAAVTEGAPPPRISPLASRRFRDRELVGSYRHVGARHARLGFLDSMFRYRRVTRGSEGLAMERSRRPGTRLLPMGGGAFAAPGAPGAGVAFTRDGAGNLLLLDGRDTFVHVGYPLHELMGDLLLVCLALALGALPTALLWGVAGRWSRRARREGGVVLTEAARGAPLLLPLAASACLAAFAVSVALVPVHRLGEPSLAGWLAFLFSLAYPVLGVAGAFVSLPRALRRFPSARALALAGLAVANAFLATCFAAWGLAGLKVF